MWWVLWKTVKQKSGVGDSGGDKVLKVVKEKFTEKVIFEQKCEDDERRSPVAIQGRGIPLSPQEGHISWISAREARDAGMKWARGGG
jgi:hypothetical protein